MEQVLPALSQPLPNRERDEFKNKGDTDYGYYLLRTNYERVKPHSKYAEEGVRPRSPNTQYSNLSDELVEKNRKKPAAFFHNTTRHNSYAESRPRHFVERHCETYNQHLIRGISTHDPYSFIAKDPFNQNVPEEHKASQYGAHPTWGPADTGFRTRSHYVGEPVERFVNIDLYRRAPTNQPGNIIFDHGRSNNGYYLQRNQYDNTWFGGNLKLNQTGILKDIDRKPLEHYEAIREENRQKLRSKSSIWPHASEYQERFAINSSTKDFETHLKK